ncbi:MAG: hypothetical protein L6R40_008033 [Gallowayella cf. fulva]|nr:MAG: hypothetical protein L6R40_008033 [Xanthomendoza cf. fulva]
MALFPHFGAVARTQIHLYDQKTGPRDRLKISDHQSMVRLPNQMDLLQVGRRLCHTIQVAHKLLRSDVRHPIKTVDPANPEEFTRPVRLHRRDPRTPIPGPAAEDGENGEIDEKQREIQEAQRAEKRRQQELNLAQIAPSANASGQRKNHYGKKTQQIYRNDQTDEQRAASRLRYEEAMPWHLEDFDNKNTWVGTYEAALSDTYTVLVLGADGKFRMIPVEKWYKFSSKNNFRVLTIDEAEEAMKKNLPPPGWIVKSRKGSDGQQMKAEEAPAGKGLYLGKFEARGPKKAVKSERVGDPDADDLDFEEDRFADDEENPYLEIPDEDAKEIEEKVKRDQLRANFFDNKDEKEADEEEEAQQKAKELEKAFGKSYKKSLMKQEKNYIYDSDSENPYSEGSESDESENDRRKEEEKKKAGGSEKGETSDREKSKASKNPSGSNTPSGRPSKHPNNPTIKKSPSSSNLKRPNSPNASDLSGNESTRKKRKQKHLTPGGPTTLKPPSRPISPDYGPPSSSAPERRPTPDVAANNKRPRADAGSGSDMSGGEMSEGKKRKKQKLKLRMSASPNETSQGSRAVSPDVKANAAAGGKAASPPAPPPPLKITAPEVRACIPAQGIAITDLVNAFKGRIHKDQMPEFRILMKSVSRYNNGTKMFHPKD